MTNKIRQKAWLVVAGAVLLFTVIALMPPENGWLTRGSKTSYYLDGKAVTGWLELGENRYYFSREGAMQTGWQEIGGARYYFTEDGAMVTGWFADAHYFYPDGRLATDWLELDGERYFLGHDGKKKAGVVESEGEKYLLNEQGFVSCGWTEVYGERYYADENGHPLFGWQKIDGMTYCFGESGAVLTGWQQLDGFTYYFYADGAAAQGNAVIDGNLHHFASDGQELVLVNPWNHMPEDYTVDLTPIEENHQIAAVACEDFLDMITDCRNAGLKPMVCSSYRTQEYQEQLYQKRIDRYVESGYPEEEATVLAGQSVAIPGTSEHQLGLALDLVDDDNWHLDETQAEMPTQKWLMENSWRYGWILRYPNEKSEITGIIYEPWHYRYVGRKIAKEIYESGLCLEEYLDMLTTAVG